MEKYDNIQVECPGCGMTQLPNRQYCFKCGHELTGYIPPDALRCGFCRAPNRREAKFCNQCGRRISAV